GRHSFVEDFVDDSAGESAEAPTPEGGDGLRPVFNLPGQREHGRHETQTVVWLFDGEAARDARGVAAREHERRVGRDSEERAVIAAGVEAAHVEVPVVAGEYEQVALDENALALAEAPDESFVAGDSRRVPVSPFGDAATEVRLQADGG